MARGFDLGVGRRSAGILGDEYIDLLLREKRRFRLDVEGAATGQQFHIGRQRDVAGRIDRTRNVVMMRTAREGIKLQAAERQEHGAGLAQAHRRRLRRSRRKASCRPAAAPRRDERP